MEKILRIYTYVDGVNDTPFPSSDNQIEIGTFDYNASRMGGAPTISATVMWESCLDDVWTNDVYAEFNGERYYLRQTPTSSYDNTDLMYEHNLTLVSERVALDNVYFYDAVSGTPQEGDKPVSHSAEVMFYGDITEFVGRLNASLEYAGMDYSVVIDDDIESEAKQMSFSNQFFSNVLQEIYNTYELPYYFVGKVIHIGYTSNVIGETFRYGIDDALLSISKNNANMKVVNRVTGLGSEGNIPYYYPNETPKACGVNVTKGSFIVQIVDGEKFEANTKIGDVLTYVGGKEKPVKDLEVEVIDFDGKFDRFEENEKYAPVKERGDFHDTAGTHRMEFGVSDAKFYDANKREVNLENSTFTPKLKVELVNENDEVVNTYEKEGFVADFDIEVPYDSPDWKINTGFVLPTDTEDEALESVDRIAATDISKPLGGWIVNDDKSKTVSSAQLGLAIKGVPYFGDTMVVVQRDYINPQRRLMPPIYRESSGDERFYSALNDTYEKEDGTPYTFLNPYTEGNPSEQIVEFPDIKPTIKGVKNDDGIAIDEFLEFAFDLNDNNEVDENGEYIHSHFFAKLPKMPFNLFDHAIESGEMTINMTGGSLGGCAFVIAVSETDDDGIQWNTVQVDDNGDLVRDEDGNVLCGVGSQGDVEPQERQNNTINNSVWIALKKDIEYTTFARPTLDATAEDGTVKIDAGGTAIEGKAGHYLPYDGSTFVITNILLPSALIQDAEERLKTALLDYLEDNNVEKFNFSITFSRIFFEENPDILELLDENARFTIEYNDKSYLLYVSSFSYSMSSSALLPEISVELSEDLSVSQGSLQRAISEVKGDLLNTIGNMDVLGQGSQYFLRKDQKDRARKKIVFEEGIEVGKYSGGTLATGAAIRVDENGGTHIEADYLKIRKKATFTTISVQEMKSVGGEIVVSPAAMVCDSVEEMTDAYRCYFNTADNDGKHIFNEFAVNDQARCQIFNVLGMRYYWRLITSVGDNYIDLSKTDCDANSDIPQAGDAIVTLGNRSDEERQNAIVHSAYGEYAPSMTQYAGINSYRLDDKMVTRFSPKGNLITGQLTLKAGSSGLEQLEEWGLKQEEIDGAKRTAEDALEKTKEIDTLSDYVDIVKEDLQKQIDGAIESFFYDYDPTTENYPASEWETDNEKIVHLNDTFTNLTDGRSWRWTRSDAGVYSWTEITDTATSEALRLAGQAQATADGKVTIFQMTPTPPYKEGDLWVAGETAPLKICVNPKNEGESYSEADWDLADNAQAYADEKSQEAEKNAKEYTDSRKFGTTNLLRNSGFTGDYTSKGLADDDVLDEDMELYSEWNAWWTTTNATKKEDAESQSGISVTIASGGSLSQELYNNVVVGESYMVSFRAKGTGNITVGFGGVSGTIALSNSSSYTSYAVALSPTTTAKVFTISGACTLCDLQLELGNVTSSWSRSFLDNSSDRAYWQSMKYLQQSIHDYSADLGGLRLGTIMSVGSDVVDESGDITIGNVTGGMNGVWDDDNSVAFWAGGTLEKAQNLVNHFVSNPSASFPSDMSNYAHFAVTHGGRAILDDMILRGYIYALGGEFTGKVTATEGEFTGTVNATSGTIGDLVIKDGGLSARNNDPTAGHYQDLTYLKSDSFSIHRYYNNGAFMESKGETTLGAGSISIYQYNNEDLEPAIYVSKSNIAFMSTESGLFAGLRPYIRHISSSDILSDTDHTIVLTNLSVITLTLPAAPPLGQVYKIMTRSNMGYTIETNGITVLNAATGYESDLIGESTITSKVVTLTYDGTYWLAEY